MPQRQKSSGKNQLIRLNIGKKTGVRSQKAQNQGMQTLRNEAYMEIRRNDERCRITPRLRFLRTHSGFSYIGVLLAVAITGIAMTAANRYWSTIVQREREAELLYRGNQIREAIESYYENPPAGQSKQYPHAIGDLLKDPRYPQVRRHLRKWYKDPLTGNDNWVLIQDAGGGIKGVYSPHQGRPLKSGNFPKEYESFETAGSYADWKVVFVPEKKI
ncbi:MAG: type II secretion system protein [Desulfosarcina sp.]|nr:type II secretion system protein [Desulfobacterales bacterium]